MASSSSSRAQSPSYPLLPGLRMVNVTFSTLLLLNAWKNLTRIRVNAKNIHFDVYKECKKKDLFPLFVSELSAPYRPTLH